jgi:hypothetical protein
MTQRKILLHVDVPGRMRPSLHEKDGRRGNRSYGEKRKTNTTLHSVIEACFTAIAAIIGFLRQPLDQLIIAAWRCR